MTDQNVWRLKRGQLDTALPDPDPEPLPENWQAVARTMISELDGEIGKRLTLRYGLHWAISLRNRDLFYCVLDRMKDLGYDRPE